MSRPTEIVLSPESCPGLPPRHNGTGVRAAPPPVHLDHVPVIVTPAASTEPTVRPDAPPPAKGVASNSRRRSASAKDTQRDFIIAYDGKFVGTYRTRRRITNQTAFRIVARQIQGQIGDEFDAAKIELYKPVRLHVDPNGTAPEAEAETFDWFSPSGLAGAAEDRA